MSRRFFRNNLLIMLALLLAGAASGSPETRQQSVREPIVITSDRMEADRLGDRVQFIGNVTLKKEDITLTSDAVTVFYDESSKGVNEIEALGNVVVRRDDRVALANKAKYYSREEKIILTGDARIIEDKNQLGGDRITFFVRDDRSIVEGGRVLFYQDEAPGTGERAEKGSADNPKPE